MCVAVSVTVSVNVPFTVSFGQPGVLSLPSLGLLVPFYLSYEHH
jgi:hypothetical protein